MGGAKRAALAGGWVASCVLGLLLAPACAGDLVAENGRLRHREHGYGVAVPDPAWQRASADGAQLVYRGPSGSVMSLISRCDRSVASPQMMSRQLTIGMRPLARHHAAPVVVRGVNGWTQALDVAQGDDTFRLKTVTFVSGGCSLDFVLVAPDDFAERERVFDGWWSTLEWTEASTPPVAGS